MNKNNYINEMNKIKPTNALKTRVLNQDDSVKSVKRHSYMAVVACVMAVLLTFGGIMTVISLESGNKSGHNAGATPVTDGLNKDIDNKTTANESDNNTDENDKNLTIKATPHDNNEFVFDVYIKNNATEDLAFSTEYILQSAIGTNYVNMDMRADIDSVQTYEEVYLKKGESKTITIDLSQRYDTEKMKDFLYRIYFLPVATSSGVSSVKTVIAIKSNINNKVSHLETCSCSRVNDDLVFDVEITNHNGDKDIITDEYVMLYEYQTRTDSWSEIPVKEGIAFKDIANIIGPGDTYKTTIDVERLFDIEKDTDYLLVKKIDGIRNPLIIFQKKSSDGIQ